MSYAEVIYLNGAHKGLTKGLHDDGELDESNYAQI